MAKTRVPSPKGSIFTALPNPEKERGLRFSRALVGNMPNPPNYFRVQFSVLTAHTEERWAPPGKPVLYCLFDAVNFQFSRFFQSSKHDPTWFDKENQQNEYAIYEGTFRK